MQELIFKFRFRSEKVEKLFHRYINLFNELYQKRENTAYFETIHRGFLYILPDLSTYKKISKSIPSREKIQKIIRNNQEKKKEFSKELFGEIGFKPDQQIKFLVDIVNYSTNQVFAPMKHIFQTVVPEIEFVPKNENHFSILFPDMEGLLNYILIFTHQIQS